MKAAFDVYTPELHSKLGFVKPKNRDEERLLWQIFSQDEESDGYTCGTFSVSRWCNLSRISHQIANVMPTKIWSIHDGMV